MSTLKAGTMMTCDNRDIEQVKANAKVLVASELFKQLLEGKYVSYDVVVTPSASACDKSAVKVNGYVNLISLNTLTIGEPLRISSPTLSSIHIDYGDFIDEILRSQYETLTERIREHYAGNTRTPVSEQG